MNFQKKKEKRKKKEKKYKEERFGGVNIESGINPLNELPFKNLFYFCFIFVSLITITIKKKKKNYRNFKEFEKFKGREPVKKLFERRL